MLILLLSRLVLACPDLDTTLERSISAMLSREDEAAAEALDSATQSVKCAAASPEQISRYLQYKGAQAWFHESHEAATPWLAAAYAADPKAFDPRLGTELEAVFRSGKAAGPATIEIDPQSAGFVDGRAVASWPLTVPAGPHAVQVRSLDEKVLFGTWTFLKEGETTRITTQLPALAETVKARRPFPTLLVSGLLAGVGSGLSAWGATRQDPLLVTANRNNDYEALQGAALRGSLLSASTYVLGAAAVTGITMQFVLPSLRHDSARPGKVELESLDNLSGAPPASPSPAPATPAPN